MKLFKINKKMILEIIGEHYGVPSMNVCIYSDYRFVRQGDDKVREDYIYGIVQTEEHVCDYTERQSAIEAWKNDFKGYINALDMPKDDYNGIMEYIDELPTAQSEQDREFIKLTVRNSNGRPYYSIIYLEVDDNGVGHDFEGYSSYSLDVISDYLKKYFMPSAQPIIRCGQCKYAEVADPEDSQDGYTCQFHRGSIWFSGSYCSWAERREE